MLEIELCGERLRLLPDRALFWPARRMLLIADTHFGKAATFRSHGIPIPTGTTAGDLARLTELLCATAAAELVVLGDFLHAARGRADETMGELCAWRAAHAELNIRLVRGNHDRAAGDPPAAWNIRCVEPGQFEPPFVFAHEPLVDDRGYALAGHLHPAVHLSDPYGGGLRAACFWFGSRRGVLPAFGAFTGGKGIAAVEGDRVFAIGPAEIVELRGEIAKKKKRVARP